MNKDINLKAVALGGLMIAGFVFLWFQTGLLPINNNSQLGAVSSSKDAGIGLVTEVKAGEQIDTTVLDGLVADYHFDENANDTSGLNNNGTPIGNPTFGTVDGRNVVTFNGTNYVSVPNSSSINLGDRLSISLWFKRENDSNANGCEILLSKGGSTSNKGGYVPAIGGNGCLVPNSLNLCFSNIGCPISSSNTIGYDNSWHHLVMIKDGSIRTIYIDNTNVSSWATNNTAGLSTPFNLFIGTDNNNNTPSGYFKGSIDELHIYNRALSQAEVLSLFQSEGGSPQPQVRLTVNKQGTGASAGTVISSVPSGAIDCGSTCNINFNQNASVTLTASAGTGSSFSSWSGCTSTNGTSCTVTMDATKTVTANFEAVQSDCVTGSVTPLPKLKVSLDGRYLVKNDGNNTPFFWLGDTAWWLDNNLSDEDICFYLKSRADQGFTGIQMMGVLYHIGLVHPWLQNPDDFNHQNPFNDSNFTIPTSFNYVQGASYPTNTQAYWNRIQWIVKQAEAKNLYVMIFPMWGKEVEPYFGGFGTASQAKEYNFGKFLGTTFSNNNNVLFSVSGEYDSINQYNPNLVTDDQFAMFNNLAQGIRDGDSTKLKTIHPGGAWSSVLQSDKFKYPGTQTNWLDINMLQSGHQYFSNPNLPFQQENYTLIENGYNSTYATPSTRKPIYDGEPFYEDLINGWYPLGETTQPRANGAIERTKAYWDVFAGGLGHTYGHANVEVFWPIGYGVDPNLTEEPINWKDAINVDLANNAGKNAGAKSLKYLRQLVESKSSPSQYQPRMPDQGIIASGQPPCPDPVHISNPDPMKNPCGGHMQAMRENGPGGKGSYAFVYIPRTTTTAGTTNVGINMTKLTGQFATARWYDPTNGTYTNIPGSFPTNNTNLIFNSNTHPLLNGDGVDSLGGQNQDWVLVLESTGTQTQLPAPTITSPIQGSSVGTTATFSWNAVSGAASYLVRLRDDSGSNTGPCNLVVCVDNYANTSYQFTNLIPGHSYSAWVHAASPGWSYGDPLSYSPASTVTFTVSSGGTLIQPVSAYSRKVQGSLPFDLELNLSGTPTVEPRMFPLTASSTHQMIIKFDPTLAPVSLSGATVTLGTVTNFAVSGTDVIVNLRDIPNTQTITVILQNVTRGQASNNVSVSMSALVGDTNGDGLVNSADKIIVRSNSGSIVSQSNFLSDVAVNGSINSGDVSLITKRLGDQLTPITPPTIFDLDVTFTPSNNLSTQASDCLLGDTFSAKTGERCSTTQSSSPSSTSFTRNLGGGSQGTDVLALQRYLITKGYLGAGYDNSYYGYQTIYAVQALQRAAGIVPASGFFGVVTRNWVSSH